MITFAGLGHPEVYRGTCYSIAKGNTAYERIAIWVPEWELVMTHKRTMATINDQLDSGRISEEAYLLQARECDQRYKDGYARLLRGRQAAVTSWLKQLTPEHDLTLICFCTREWKVGGRLRPRFCHRQLVASVIGKWRPDVPLACY
jgi:hypothetical protein